jgi:hypothetical protein
MTPNNSSELFWSMVDIRSDDECWVWTGTRTNKGYGRTFWQGSNRGTHRIAYTLTYGEIGHGLNVLHKCDNPPCCNPNHLFSGTQHENNTDKKNKGRASRLIGERNPKARLTWEQVREIRRLHSEGMAQNALAKKFEINTMSICSIVNHKQWKE